MLYFSRWKSTLILLSVLAGMMFALPNFVSQQTLNKLPSWIPTKQVNLGLDLQGGVQLLIQVDREALLKERVSTILDDVRRIMRQDRQIRYRINSGLKNAVELRLREPGDVAKAKTLLREITQPISAGGFGQSQITEVDLDEPSEGVLVFSLTNQGINYGLASAVTQSIEVIRKRIDEFGTTEPVVQRQGNDRILVEVPGVDDPERLKSLIGTTAKLSFHLVNTDMTAEEALQSRAPAGTVIMYDDGDPPIPELLQTSSLVKGENLVDAQPGFDQQTNEPIVTFRFDSKGGSRFCQVSTANIGRRFAIVLDQTVITAPVIQSAICGGSGQISGNFTVEGANNLAVLLRAGALPAKLDFIEERTVGPSLGKDSIEAGQIASIIGAVLVLIFMVLAYGFLGVLANIALIANISIILGLLSIIGATLTLPGIAGIVLTMGMAVDANVLIFERIREERRGGRSLIQAVDAGFRRALATIVDANITTLIAAAILFYLGSGPVKGFAVTLAIGIITTVFTAYTLTRLMVALWVKWKKPKDLPRRLITFIPVNTKLRFMRNRVIAFPVSVIAIVASIALFFSLSLNYGIDFLGGTMIEVQAKQEQSDIGGIRSALRELNLGDVQVQEFGNAKDILIRVESQNAGEAGEQSVIVKVRDALEADYEFRRVEVVGPTVSGELAQAGLLAIVGALAAIMVYIWIRFEWQFAIGAVAATLHDVLLTIGIFSLMRLEFNLSTIAAVLTIVGYSLNDTVVVYDRVRENLRKYKKMAIPDLLDLSINQMLSRTILTSVTTLLALFSLYIFGGEVLASFTFAMIFGVFVGTYSSIFIAAPMLIYFKLRPGQIAGSEVEEDNQVKA
ncbi:MAG: protein translocase subunit SecD [Rhizobiaceae bacterium]|nr:protein translocase subunit SecD [Rhizobiaceae bacterium]